MSLLIPENSLITYFYKQKTTSEILLIIDLLFIKCL